MKDQNHSLLTWLNWIPSFSSPNSFYGWERNVYQAVNLSSVECICWNRTYLSRSSDNQRDTPALVQCKWNNKRTMTNIHCDATASFWSWFWSGPFKAPKTAAVDSTNIIFTRVSLLKIWYTIAPYDTKSTTPLWRHIQQNDYVLKIQMSWQRCSNYEQDLIIKMQSYIYCTKLWPPRCKRIFHFFPLWC